MRKEINYILINGKLEEVVYSAWLNTRSNQL